MFTLTISEKGVTRTFQVPAGETMIGRGPMCGLVVNAEGVSRQHARLRVADGRAFLSDAGSRNGTILNSKKLSAEEEIRHGDTFEIGAATVSVEQSVADRLERRNGPVRIATLPGEAHPVTFSVHGAIAEHYQVDPASLPESHASTIDYVIAATAG